MNAGPSQHSALGILDAIAAGRASGPDGNSAHSLALYVGDLFHTTTAGVTAAVTATGAAVRFDLDLSRIYIRNLGEQTRCLILGGSGAAAADAVRDFYKTRDGGLMFVFCVTPGALEQAHQFIPPGYALVVAPDAFRGLLTGLDPGGQLKKMLRGQIGRRRLSLYDICQPATGNAFFGRERELAQLLEHDTTSFAIPGPGRIGKSSLLKRHHWNLRRRRDPRVDRTFEIDFYSVSKLDIESVVRHIATKISDTYRGHTLRVSGFIDFLRYWRNQLGGPLELILDETDEVCSGPAFDQLGQAAKDGYVRLIMAGRGGLFKFATQSDSPMAARLRVLLLEPLEPATARELFCHPLADLGLHIRNPSLLVDYVLKQTGRLPHLIQFYAQNLVELSVERRLDELDIGDVHAVESTGTFSQYFLAPLLELDDADARTLACALLATPLQRYTTAEVLAAALRLGLPNSPVWVRRTCDELVIRNILLWEGGLYRASSQALRVFAEQAGLLAGGRA
ncbi:MAG TPA: hypothetical protein VD866_03865 [Urbifossiella sp.]|nr:hypothetical protein [Urbifossiella sp.]